MGIEFTGQFARTGRGRLVTFAKFLQSKLGRTVRVRVASSDRGPFTMA